MSHKIRTLLLVFSTLLLFSIPFSIIKPDPFSENWLVHSTKKEYPSFFCPEIRQIVSQPLEYLGQGGQSVAFVSHDDKYVLKFFLKKRYHTKARYKPISSFLNYFKSSRKLRDKSCLLDRYTEAFKKLKNETGIIAIHFGSNTILPSCVLVDYEGKKHNLDLNLFSFVVQKRGKGISNTFSKMTPLEKKKALSSLENLVQNMAKKGFVSYAKSFNPNNFAFVDNKAIMIDLGHLTYSTKQENNPEPEETRVKKLLSSWKKTRGF